MWVESSHVGAMTGIKNSLRSSLFFCISVKDYNWRIPITAPWKRPVLCWWWRTLPREFRSKALWQFLHVKALSNLAFSISVSGNMSFCMIIFSHIVFFRRKCDRKTSRQRRLLSKGKVRKFRHRLWILLDSKSLRVRVRWQSRLCSQTALVVGFWGYDDNQTLSGSDRTVPARSGPFRPQNY